MSFSLADLFKVKSVESITGKLNSTVSELEAHAAEQAAKAAAQKALAVTAQVAAQAHTAEHALATKIAGNIKSLLGA